ncbi:MAG: hypothetical protein M1301_00365 [Candidatus Thermoplasmatota archaeon]|jgi:hypothetical protein|nr:hypothetical protein [Candidatus Thermoplasmatota archaeon]
MISGNANQNASSYGYIAKGILSNLFDAISYSRRSADKRDDSEKLQKEMGAKLSRSDELFQSINRMIKQYYEEIGLDTIKENLDSITSFANVSLDQVKTKISKAYSSKIKEIGEEIESNRTLSVKALEAFVSGNYLPVRENSIILKSVEGGYDARAKYLSDGGIEYDFSLNAKNLDIFRDILFFSSLIKAFRIPVGTAGTWISKEPVIDYEKVDRYVMTSAELSGDNLICNFGDDSKQSSFKFIFSKGINAPSLSVDYTDPGKQVDITSQPALNKNLDTDSLSAALNRVMSSMKSLESHKLRLLKLSVGDDDILSSTNYVKFMKSVIDIAGPDFKPVFQKILESDFTPSPEFEKNGITKDYISSRLKNIGDSSKELLEFLSEPQQNA